MPIATYLSFQNPPIYVFNSMNIILKPFSFWGDNYYLANSGLTLPEDYQNMVPPAVNNKYG